MRTRNTDPWYVASQFLRDRPRPVVLDVGANCGQTVTQCLRRLPGARIYSFEPSPSTYRALQAATAQLSNVCTFNVGMGDRPSMLTLLENDYSDMSSFLPPDRDAWGQIVRETPVEVWTVDQFRQAHGIDRIDVLKTDTQGFDLAVLQGAQTALAEGAVDLILTEITFSSMYEGLPRWDELIRFLLDHGFRLVNLYQTSIRHGVAGWCDALLAHERLMSTGGLSHSCGSM